MSKPHKCPVCEGSGGYFYNLPLHSGGTLRMNPDTGEWQHWQSCSACEGTGIVWEPEPTTIRLDLGEIGDDTSMPNTCSTAHRQTLPPMVGNVWLEERDWPLPVARWIDSPE